MSQYLNSPSYRRAKRNVIGFLIIFAVMFAVFAAILFTV